MRADASGVVELNGVTLLAGFLVILIVVMGGFTYATPRQPAGEARTPTADQDFFVAVEDQAVEVENLDSRPHMYDQLALYVQSPETTQQLPLEEDFAAGDDGDSVFERGETLRRPLNTTVEAGTPVTVKLVDTGGSDILYSTTVNATAG